MVATIMTTTTDTIVRGYTIRNIPYQGTSLQVLDWGTAEKGRPSVFCIHGFCGSAHDFQICADSFSGHLLALNLFGHGGSAPPPNPQALILDETVEQVIEATQTVGLHAPVLLGYSMGARVALATVLAHPEQFSGLILIGATAGLQGEENRRSRCLSDTELADRAQRMGSVAFSSYWAKQPLIQTQEMIPEPYRRLMLAERQGLDVSTIGASLEGLGQGVCPDQWERLDTIALPTTLITGELDTKYGQIAEKMTGLLQDGKHIVLPHVGHAAHLECPLEFSGVLDSILDRV
tara:strand:- start:237 stop:1109 length:873 start_codon:yes stop_codon:yes gene_type:complete